MDEVGMHTYKVFLGFDLADRKEILRDLNYFI